MQLAPHLSTYREMARAELTAGDGAKAASAFRTAGLRNTQDFAEACKSSGASDKIRLPRQALDALVAANINYYALDSWDVAIARVLGLPYYRRIRADRALSCEPLRVLYLRANARRPSWARPCPVTPFVRCALRACIRNRTALTPADVLPVLRKELSRDPVGIMGLPGPMKAIRRLVRTVLLGVFSVVAVRAPWVANWLVRIIGKENHAVSATAQLCIVASAWAFASLVMAFSTEWARADGHRERQDSDSPGARGTIYASSLRANTLRSTVFCATMLVALLY